MLHARWVRPSQGPWLTDGFAKPLKVDASSIEHLPRVKVVQQGDFLGVVGPAEYEVVQAAAQLKVTWARVADPAGSRQPLGELPEGRLGRVDAGPDHGHSR